MKKFALAAALSLTTSTAFAGGLDKAIVEPAPIVAVTTQSSSAGGLVVPLLLLLIVAAIVSAP